MCFLLPVFSSTCFQVNSVHEHNTITKYFSVGCLLPYNKQLKTSWLKTTSTYCLLWGWLDDLSTCCAVGCVCGMASRSSMAFFTGLSVGAGSCLGVQLKFLGPWFFLHVSLFVRFLGLSHSMMAMLQEVFHSGRQKRKLSQVLT